MLVSVVVTLTAVNNALLPAALGRGAHALFLRLVSRVDAALAAALHGEQRAKPFTAGVLEDGATTGQRETACRAGWRCHLRFTSLETRLSELLMERALPGLPAVVELDGAAFRVEGVSTRGEEHPWAAQSSYQEIGERRLLERVQRERLRFLFHSPTTFRSQTRHVPLPLPELVFGSLLERWNAFAPVRLDEDLPRRAGEALAISRYRLETRLVMLGGGKQVGFVGRCEYAPLKPDPALLAQLGALADYAFFCGIGHKTTMGLGRACRLPLEAGSAAQGACANPRRCTISEEVRAGKTPTEGVLDDSNKLPGPLDERVR